jgi:hypothetical protein
MPHLLQGGTWSAGVRGCVASAGWSSADRVAADDTVF